MSAHQNDYFFQCDDKRRQCSLPPKVMGNVCGFLTLKVGRILWSTSSFKNVLITVRWWGESKPLILRPFITDEKMCVKIGNEIIYEIRTDPETFEQYLRDCESLEFDVINEEVNESIGKISVPNLTSLISERRHEGCFSVIDTKGFVAGDIFITFDLFLLQKHLPGEVRFHQNTVSEVLNINQKDQISDFQNGEEFNQANSKSLFTWLCYNDSSAFDDKDDKAFKQTILNDGSIEKSDSEFNDGNQECSVGTKETNPPDFIGGTVQHHEAVKQANSLRINILNISLNLAKLHQENLNLKHFRSNYNMLCQHTVSSSLPSKHSYFVEYEIPALLNITTNKSDISRNVCPWNRRIIRFCSRKQMGSEIYFGQSSVYHLPKRKDHWLDYFKDMKIVIKVFLRNSNQRVPQQIGKAALEMCSVINSESLSFSYETPVFSLAQVPCQFCIGKVRTKIELGRNCKYFGKEFFKIIVNGNSDSVKEWGTKKNKVQENREEAFNVFHMSEKEQQKKNKENFPGTKMKQQCVEKPLILYGLIYISSGRGFHVVNSYIISKSFWKEDFAISNLCWETSSPNYNLREIIPVLLSTEFLERCRKNFLVVEVWERKPEAKDDGLIGIAKLSLNQFFVAFRNPHLTEQLIQAKYPLVGVDGWVNVYNPMTRLCAGQLHAVLCLGTEDQIQLFERIHGTMETSCVPTRTQPFNSRHYGISPFAIQYENLMEVSGTQYQVKSGLKQIGLPSKCANGGNIDNSQRELLLEGHQHNKINQENTNIIKNDNKNLANPSEVLITKHSSTSFVPNMSTNTHNLQQDAVGDKNSQNYGTYVVSQNHHQENCVQEILATTSGISVAENIILNKLDTDKPQDNLVVTKVIDNSVSAEKKNQQCQTDLFVVDFQHYGPDFLTKHDKNIKPMIFKLSSKGLEIIEMNSHNSNAAVLDTKFVKDVTYFKEHDPLNSNSGDDTAAHGNREYSDGKFSTEKYNTAKKNKDKNHEIKSADNVERESKTSMCNSHQNSMKLNHTLAADGTEITQVAKVHNLFKNIETPTEIADSAQFPVHAHATAEYSIVSGSSNFCARIEVNEARNLSIHGSDDVERYVCVSFCLNHGCAKVIIDGEVQLKTGLLFTPAVACNGNPVWNWHCEAWLPSDLLTDTSKQLIVKIWQKSNKIDAADPLADVLLGLTSIDLTVILLGVPWVCDWFNIVNFTGTCIGQIKVSVKPQENLDRFRSNRINPPPDSNANNSLIETSILQNANYPQETNSSLKRRENYQTNMQKINNHHPERSSPTEICFVGHKKATGQASSLADIKASKHGENIPLEWDLDFPDDTTSLLTKAFRQKLSELDEITKRLKRRLLSVTSEEVSPANLDWNQEEAGILYCEKSDQKQKSSARMINSTQICTAAKVDAPKDGSYDATYTLLHHNCRCTQLSTSSWFQHSGNACQLKHLDNLYNKMSCKLCKILGNETSYEQLQCNCEKTSESQFGNLCLQPKESNADLEIRKKDIENNDTGRGVNRDNDVEDFDALTDILMETATKELDIANVFNPLLFQQLLLTNANVIESKFPSDKCNKQKNVYNLSQNQNSSEILFKCDETLQTVCTMNESDDKVQYNASCYSENTKLQCSEDVCYSNLGTFHEKIEIKKFKELGDHITSEKEQSCKENYVTSKRDFNDSSEISKPLAPLIDASNRAESSLSAVHTISTLEKQCEPQQYHQLEIAINEQSFEYKVSPSNENEIQERLSVQELNESHKEETESYSEFSSATRKQKLLQHNMKKAIEASNTQYRNDNKEYPLDLQGKRKRSLVCRLAPSFFQKFNMNLE